MPAPIIRVAAPRVQAVARRAKHYARRAGSAALGAARSEQHTIAAAVGAAALALAEKHGYPTLMGFPTDVAGGVALWLAGRYTRHPALMHAATGFIAIAVHRRVAASKVVGDGRAVVYDTD
jgi:hypothetical protein